MDIDIDKDTDIDIDMDIYMDYGQSAPRNPIALSFWNCPAFAYYIQYACDACMHVIQCACISSPSHWHSPALRIPIARR